MLRLGLLGLGRAARQAMRALSAIDGIELSAVADVRQEALNEFAGRGISCFLNAAELVASPNVDIVWIATPSNLHCEHVLAAAAAGKHVICEKPMAISRSECQQMDAAAKAANTRLLMVSKIFDPPILAMRAIIDTGELGSIKNINMSVYTDWLARPRIAQELDPAQGGGVVFRQAPHMVDIARYLAGSPVSKIFGHVQAGEIHAPTPGLFNALLAFSNGASASLSFNGSGVFDSAELTWNIGETGRERMNAIQRSPRVVSAEEKANAVAEDVAQEQLNLPFYGLTMVACSTGFMRQSRNGIIIYGPGDRREISIIPRERCVGELLEMRDAINKNLPVFPDAEWGSKTMEICLQIAQSRTSF